MQILNCETSGKFVDHFHWHLDKNNQSRRFCSTSLSSLSLLWGLWGRIGETYLSLLLLGVFGVASAKVWAWRDDFFPPIVPCSKAVVGVVAAAAVARLARKRRPRVTCPAWSRFPCLLPPDRWTASHRCVTSMVEANVNKLLDKRFSKKKKNERATENI